jgi:N-formylglutamate deformylase
MTHRSLTPQAESNHAYTYHGPAPQDLIPLVVDSPHSCPAMPEGSGCVAPQNALMTAVDAFVDELWAPTPTLGGQLLCAAFHRCFIDVNRSPLDIDESMLATPWPTLTMATEKSQRGQGLVRRLALPGVPMYDRLLTVTEVQHRLRAFYMPYHDRLGAAIEMAHARFGQAWHIDAHSMKSVGNAMNVDEGAIRPDVVVSDASGGSADCVHTQWVAGWWGRAGYAVSINEPYKGGEIVRRFGRPLLGRHSIPDRVQPSPLHG